MPSTETHYTTHHLAEERADDRVDIELLQVGVLLAGADKHDGLACLVRHGERRADLSEADHVRSE